MYNQELIQFYKDKISSFTTLEDIMSVGVDIFADDRINNDDMVEILEHSSHRLFALGHISLETRDSSIKGLYENLD